MAFNRRKLKTLATVLALALLGLTAVQVSLLSTALRSEKQAFADNVQAALNQVSLRLAADEAVQLAFAPLNSPGKVQRDSLIVMADVNVVNDGDSCVDKTVIALSHEEPPQVEFGDSTVRYRLQSPQRVQVFMFNPTRDMQTKVLDTFSTAGTHEISMEVESSQFPGEGYYWKFVSDSTVLFSTFKDTVINWRHTSKFADTGRQLLVRSVLQQLETADLKPIEERIPSETLDSTLSAAFRQAGIDLPYAFGVLNPLDDSLELVSQAVLAKEILASPFRSRLFPYQILAGVYELAVYFPDHTGYIWSRIAILAVPTLVLMLMISGGFVYTIRTLSSQRRFAGLLVDFINNMTHEFKTPIATVQLASEAIDRDDVVADPSRVRQFSSMIRSETGRMKAQADRILQMAVVEEGELDLAPVAIDIHALLENLLATTRLQVEEKGGEVSNHFNADPAVVLADPVHVTNVLTNLLDNAIKYSRSSPKIAVLTSSEEGWVTVQVSDNGIGISPADQKMVFDKYFRVPQGNIHNVKGFGLGLSYVKLIVEALGGAVQLQSTPGTGSTITLRFPAARSEDEVL